VKDQPIIKPRSSDLPINKQKFNRKATVFAVCLVIAGFFWVITTLSMEFSSTIKFPVNYINMPKDKLISNNLPDSIELEVKGSGFDIVRFRIKQHLEPVLLDASSYKPHKGSDYFYFTTNSKLDNISRQMGTDLHVLGIIPDTIFLNFSKKISKLVPVRAEINLSFEKGFQQADSILILPREIRISGSQTLVEKVKELHTQNIAVAGLNKTVTLRRALVVGAELKQLELSVDSVSIHVPVTKFTEGMQEIQVEALNVPLGTTLKVFPDRIKVTYLVAFDAFEKIKPEMFSAVVDYSKLEPGSSKIKVELKRFPPRVRSININPERVEYILRK
jgi:YbbR domain-containing protein